MAKRRVVDARADNSGNITQVKLSGNTTFTPVKTAMKMADKGLLENAHTVRSRVATDHLRTNPDAQKRNNLDDMAGDK